MTKTQGQALAMLYHLIANVLKGKVIKAKESFSGNIITLKVQFGQSVED